MATSIAITSTSFADHLQIFTTLNFSQRSRTLQANKIHPRRNTVKKSLMIAALFGGFMVLSISSEAYGQGVNLTGTWQVKSDKEPGVTVLKLSQSGDSVSGKWQPAHGDASEIENGKIVGETLTFSFTHNTHQINATGHLSGDTISFDITGHKWGMSKTVHRSATRIASN
jgi:hypothetical protein